MFPCSGKRIGIIVADLLQRTKSPNPQPALPTTRRRQALPRPKELVKYQGGPRQASRVRYSPSATSSHRALRTPHIRAAKPGPGEKPMYEDSRAPIGLQRARPLPSTRAIKNRYKCTRTYRSHIGTVSGVTRRRFGRQRPKRFHCGGPRRGPGDRGLRVVGRR